MSDDPRDRKTPRGRPTRADSERPLRVLILEDEPVVARSLRRLLVVEGHEAEICGTVREAVAAVERASFDGWMLDVALPDGTGLDFLAARREAGDRTPTTIMTGRKGRDLMTRAAALGATFCPKPAQPEDVDAFMRWIRRGEKESAEGRVEKLIADSHLSPREADVLRVAVTRASLTEIADILEMSEHTVRTHVKGILQKTGYPSLRAAVAAILLGPAA